MAIKAYNGLNADNWDYVKRVLMSVKQISSFQKNNL